MNTLEEARERIDAIDREVLSLLAERERITRELGAWKREQGIAMRDVERESEMLRERAQWARELGLSAWVAEAVTRVVLIANRGMTEGDREGLVGGG